MELFLFEAKVRGIQFGTEWWQGVGSELPRSPIYQVVPFEVNDTWDIHEGWRSHSEKGGCFFFEMKGTSKKYPKSGSPIGVNSTRMEVYMYHQPWWRVTAMEIWVLRSFGRVQVDDTPQNQNRMGTLTDMEILQDWFGWLGFMMVFSSTYGNT